MSYKTPEGCKFLFSTTFAAAKTISALTNDDPAEATSTAHGFTEGDEILLISGWEDATDSVFRVGTVGDANTFEIDGLDTSDTNWFSPGGGLGTAAKISNWIEIPQVLTTAPNGGDPRNIDKSCADHEGPRPQGAMRSRGSCGRSRAGAWIGKGRRGRAHERGLAWVGGKIGYPCGDRR